VLATPHTQFGQAYVCRRSTTVLPVYRVSVVNQARRRSGSSSHQSGEARFKKFTRASWPDQTMPKLQMGPADVVGYYGPETEVHRVANFEVTERDVDSLSASAKEVPRCPY
jgi:hypothetical protein